MSFNISPHKPPHPHGPQPSELAKEASVQKVLAEMARENTLTHMAFGDITVSLDNLIDTAKDSSVKAVEEKVDEVKSDVADVKMAVENIDIDTSDLAKESTLATIGSNASTDFATIKDAVKKNGTTVIDAVNYNIQQVSNQQGYLQNTIAKETTAQAAANDAAAAKTAAEAITGYALQGNDPTATNTAILQAIQANAGVPTLTIPDSTAAQELAPNVLYVFDNRTSRLTLTLGAPIAGIANEYHFFVICGATAPTIIFPSGITWNDGAAPNIIAGTTYEISILNNVAAYFRV